MLAPLIFLLGLAVGSFTTVVVEREGATASEDAPKVNRLQALFPWAFGRSHCDHCSHPIPWFDNVPLLSYLFLQGRCRYCQKPIPFRYFVTELLMAVLFLWAFLNLLPLTSDLSQSPGPLFFFGPLFSGSGLFTAIASSSSFPLLLATFFVFLWALISIALVDLRFGLIPDGVLLASGFIVLAIRVPLVLSGQDLGSVLLNPLLWAFFAALFFALLVFLTRGRGMGWGDVKLVFWMGLWLNWQVIVALWLAFLTGAAAGLILILLRRKKWGQTLPFGPFLTWGALVSAFASPYLLSLILPNLVP